MCVCVYHFRARESVLQLLHTVLAATLIAVIVRVYREGITEQPPAKVPRGKKGAKKKKGKKGQSLLREEEREEKQWRSAAACSAQLFRLSDGGFSEIAVSADNSYAKNLCGPATRDVVARYNKRYASPTTR